MSEKSPLPIGVFDSGLGGLTVVKELSRLLPHEEIIYVGDTARVPYGTKSPDLVRRYSEQIAFFLLRNHAKMIVVACNTASAVALEGLKHLPIPVVGVIEPGARAAVMASNGIRVGVIGTPGTVASHAYKLAIQRYSRKARVFEQACPLFVPLVEEGWITHPITRMVAREYLKPLVRSEIESLVLGCTHYPLLKDIIGQLLGKHVALIDSARETAKEVEAVLKKADLLNSSKKKGRLTCYVTDRPRSFTRLARQFLGITQVPAKKLVLESV